MLILNFLVAEKQRTTAERPDIEIDTDKIYQPKYFLKWLNIKTEVKKYIYLKNAMLWKSNFGFFCLFVCFHNKQEAMDTFQVKMNQISSRETS